LVFSSTRKPEAPELLKGRFYAMIWLFRRRR
jgi:hypothetical protein